jgi:hypothetical protein
MVSADNLFTIAKHEVVGSKDRLPLHLIVGEGVRVRRRRIPHLRLAKLLSTRLWRTNALDLQFIARGIRQRMKE